VDHVDADLVGGLEKTWVAQLWKAEVWEKDLLATRREEYSRLNCLVAALRALAALLRPGLRMA
jgi:hypothetical protein